MDPVTAPAADPPSVDAVLTAGAAAFGAEPCRRRLPGERTHNGRTEVAGVDVVLKVHPAQDRPDIELETAALLHLQADPAVAALVPAPVVSPRTGELVVHVAPDDEAGSVTGSVSGWVAGAGAVVRAVTWTPGRPWSQVSPDSGPPNVSTGPGLLGEPTGTGLLGELGALVARVDAGLADLSHPRERTLRWNLATASANLDLVARIADPGTAAQVHGILEQARDVVEPALRLLPQQLIHNDANEANLVIGDDDRLHLIDFGDLCVAPRICGLAVAATYRMADAALRGRPLWPVLRPIVLGYHSQAPLTASELALLPQLVRIRAAVSVAMSAWQYSQDPGNEYLLVSRQSSSESAATGSACSSASIARRLTTRYSLPGSWEYCQADIATLTAARVRTSCGSRASSDAVRGA